MICIEELFEGVKRAALTGHLAPDGDCVGSALGVYNYIRENMPGIEVDIYLEPVPEEFLFLKNSDVITDKASPAEKYDLFLVLDCAAFDRFEPFRKMFDNAVKTAAVDHHISGENIADLNIIEPKISSCCELIYDMMNPDKISKAVAECLYLGIVHDTGVFKYQGVTAKTMKIAGALMEKGIDFTSIIDDTFYMRTYRQSQVIGKALLESVLFCNEKCIFSVLTKKDMEFYGVKDKDLSGVVEQLRLNDTVEVAIFIHEIEANTYKVSLRSKNYVDVSRIAQRFGGGGHVRASGFSMAASTPRDIINNLGVLIEQQL